MFPAKSMKEFMYKYTNGGDCPKCGNKTRMIDGMNGLFFGCTQYFVNGCKGKLNLKLIDYCAIYWMEIELRDKEMDANAPLA